MDYFIIAITTVAGLAFHAWLIIRFRRWADRDLALSIAGSDPDRRAWMLQRLADAKTRRSSGATCKVGSSNRPNATPTPERGHTAGTIRRARPACHIAPDKR